MINKDEDTTRQLRAPVRLLRPTPLRTVTDTLESDKPRKPNFLRRFILNRRWFHLVVTLPVVTSAVYFGFFASDQFVSESKFIVRSRSQLGAPSGLSQFLSLTALSRSQDESYTVQDYIQSRDAMLKIDKTIDLRGIYRREGVDFLSGFTENIFGNTNEDLLSYYRRQVNVIIDSQTGISTLHVFAFDAEDARRINDALLGMSESIVNKLNDRADVDSLNLAKSEVKISEARVSAASRLVTQFRNSESTLDPAKGSLMVVEIVSKLEASLSGLKSQITELENSGQSNNPRLPSLRSKAKALEDQITEQRGRLTGDASVVPEQIEKYEGLLLEKEFAEKALASATASLEAARIEARRQNLYLVRVVEPDRPDEALYPRRLRNALTVAVTALMIYGLGALLLAGAKEHMD